MFSYTNYVREDSKTIKLRFNGIDKNSKGASSKLVLSSNPKYFVSNSNKAIKRLFSEKKPNLVYKFMQSDVDFTDSHKLTSFTIGHDRMPFRLLEYVIQFFTESNVH